MTLGTSPKVTMCASTVPRI